MRQLTIFDVIDDLDNPKVEKKECDQSSCNMLKQFRDIKKQYRDIKKQYPDALLLFRCGNFYEAYAQDATEASRILHITLTYRTGIEAGDRVALAGFPFHALDTYLPKLVRAGKRVAICDQLK